MFQDHQDPDVMVHKNEELDDKNKVGYGQFLQRGLNKGEIDKDKIAGSQGTPQVQTTYPGQV